MKEEIKIDANRLIAEVHKRPALWNQKHILYHNRNLTNRVWMELSALLKLPKAVLKAKWKGLRDTFRAEIKKDQIYRKNKFSRQRPIWIHYKHLQFLKEQMIPRPPVWERVNCTENSGVGCSHDKYESRPAILRKSMQKSTKKVAQKSNQIQAGDTGAEDSPAGDESQNELKLEPLDESSSQVVPAFSDQSTTTPVLDSADAKLDQITVKEEPIENSFNTEFPDVCSEGNQIMPPSLSPPEQALASSTEANSLDDNYHFLMSLLPHIRVLSAERRMHLRMKMQELVYTDVYKKNPADSGVN